MHGKATTATWALPPATGEAGGTGRNVLSLFLGAAFTLALFLGIAHYQDIAPELPPPSLDDLRIAILPVQPPPVPVTPTEPVPDFTPMAGFEFSHADSAVKIAVSPPELTAILPEDLSKAPPANAHFTLRADLKPKTDFLLDAQHVYQKSEVDRIPEVLDRPTPSIPNRVRDNARVLRITLVMVINADGTIGNIRLTSSSGNPEFDSLMAASAKEWIFTPAIKAGRKVRCLIEQKITVKWTAGSPFEL